MHNFGVIGPNAHHVPPSLGPTGFWAGTKLRFGEPSEHFLVTNPLCSASAGVRPSSKLDARQQFFPPALVHIFSLMGLFFYGIRGEGPEVMSASCFSPRLADSLVAEVRLPPIWKRVEKKNIGQKEFTGCRGGFIFGCSCLISK